MKTINKNTSYDILIIGAGISGLTLAERYANVLNKRVLVLEKRNHIGGNCYDYYDEASILVPKYGPHFFHTNSDMVWKYVGQFTEWISYEHKVLSFVDGLLVPVPVNINTINILFDTKIKNSHEMQKWLNKNTEHIASPKNSEEVSLNRVGKYLYEKMFKFYTKKQWDIWPKELDSHVMSRIPVRDNFDDRYFTDKHQAIPKEGYTILFRNMVKNKNIKILLNTDFIQFSKENNINSYQKVFFTGPIDLFFQYKFGKLQYRSIHFTYHTYNLRRFQLTTVVNYPSPEIPWTRITEPKLATGQSSKYTTIIKEHPTWDGDPYYPVLSDINIKTYKKYQSKANRLKLKNVYFVGRLGEYKYFNMDQAFENALNLFSKLESSTYETTK